MIVGLGIDVASIERIRRLLDRHGARFAHRILTDGERDDLKGRVDQASAVAARFAAKEAVFKALGGPPNVSWQHISLRRAPGSAPQVQVHGPAREWFERLGVQRTWVSVTHDAGVAAVVVVLEKD